MMSPRQTLLLARSRIEAGWPEEWSLLAAIGGVLSASALKALPYVLHALREDGQSATSLILFNADRTRNDILTVIDKAMKYGEECMRYGWDVKLYNQRFD